MSQGSDFETQAEGQDAEKASCKASGKGGPGLTASGAPSAFLRAAVSKAKADGVPNAIEKRTVPRIYYATRTHSQIAQVRLSYRDLHAAEA
jgi:hypothetical protein